MRPICLCGGTAFRHREFCPWPLFRATPHQERAWLLACRVLAERQSPLAEDMEDMSRPHCPEDAP